MTDIERLMADNQANWDDRVSIHVGSDFYETKEVRAGGSSLLAIERDDLQIDQGGVKGCKVFHPQCHFGLDTLSLVRAGASEAIGVDFSGEAVKAANGLAAETSLNAQFIQSNVYNMTDHPDLQPHLGTFDLCYVTWGALNWLPDLKGWADAVHAFLKPGGRLYLAEGHPIADCFDEERDDGRFGWRYPYFTRQGDFLSFETDVTYTGDPDKLVHRKTNEWYRPLSEILSTIIASGLMLNWVKEHDRLPWPMIPVMESGGDGLYYWPKDNPDFPHPLPLAYSLMAEKPE